MLNASVKKFFSAIVCRGLLRTGLVTMMFRLLVESVFVKNLTQQERLLTSKENIYCSFCALDDSEKFHLEVE